jgi:hypothetical protein
VKEHLYMSGSSATVARACPVGMLEWAALNLGAPPCRTFAVQRQTFAQLPFYLIHVVQVLPWSSVLVRHWK